MVIIDAQVHVWGPDTPERPWPPDGAANAHRSVPLGKDELLRGMDAAGVDRVVIVPPSWEGDRNDLAFTRSGTSTGIPAARSMPTDHAACSGAQTSHDSDALTARR
jgi:hypothetical protein